MSNLWWRFCQFSWPSYEIWTLKALISPAEHLCYWSVCEGAAILHLLSTFRAFWHASARDIFSCLFVDWAGSRSASYSGCLCSGGCCLGHHMCRCFSYNMIIFLKNYWIWRLIRWISNILSLKTDIFRGGHTVFIWNSITKKICLLVSITLHSYPAKTTFWDNSFYLL